MTLPSGTVAEVARAVANRQLSPVEVVDAALRRIEELNPKLNAFLSVRAQAVADAQAAERAIARGKTAPLMGVPISIKDLIFTKGDRTTAGSRIFEDALPADHDAPVVQRLKRAGAIIIGKNNLHEIALGVTNLNEHFGPARNPWDTTRVPGGSSGGSAVAVAAGMGCASVGSDTRGSIRIPAACCGVTGFKPTYGLVPTDDVIPLAWSLDHVGPITRTVEDAALMLGAMVGGRAVTRYVEALDKGIKKVRIGICEYFLRDLDPEVERAVLGAIEVLRAGGATVRDVTLPEVEDSHAFSGVISLSQAITYHDEMLKKRPDRYGAAVRARLEAGYRLTAIDLVRAERRRALLVSAIDRLFDEVDCLAGATIPAFANPIGDDDRCCSDSRPRQRAGLPRVSAPP